jgi:hypothetical protein
LAIARERAARRQDAAGDRDGDQGTRRAGLQRPGDREELGMRVPRVQSITRRKRIQLAGPSGQRCVKTDVLRRTFQVIAALAAAEREEALEKAAAMKRLRDEGTVFHGLRKNAVNMLLEAGGTEAEVAAIVEMSEQMVRHYSRAVNKRRLAINGMKKLEAGWTEMRSRIFGKGNTNG